MVTTAELYNHGARAPWADYRESDHGMKERVRLSGLFPRVRDRSLTKDLQELVMEFEQNAALVAVLEQRRALEGRSQYDLQVREAIDEMNTNLAPWARLGRSAVASSASVAQQVAAGETDASAGSSNL